MKKLVAFTGLKRSGKTSAAEATKWRHINFADPLKSMIKAYLESLGVSADMIYEYMEGNLKEVAAQPFMMRTPRHAMQTLGTEWGRNLISGDIWVEAYRLRVVGSSHDNIVTSDLRFLNEAETIKRLGGKIIKIVRPGVKADDAHQSEREMALIEPDYIVQNDGSIAELRRKVLDLVS